jgi:hypothetical protein
MNLNMLRVRDDVRATRDFETADDIRSSRSPDDTADIDKERIMALSKVRDERDDVVYWYLIQ